MINFELTLRTLADAGVEFVIVGGFAMVVHGSAQVTVDLDICYQRSPANLKRLAAALSPYHPRLRGVPDGVPCTLDQRTLSQGMNFTLETDLGQLDLLGELAGLGQFAQVAKDAILTPIYGGRYRVASLDAVIQTKRAAGRPKDINSLPELFALKELQSRSAKKGKK